jgi:cytochrome c oxidase subunit 1
MVLPAMGVISELVAAFCRKQVFGYSFVAFASLAIAVLGFLVWGPPHVRGRHLGLRGADLLDPQLPRRRAFAVKVFNWTATMYKGSVSWQTPMLYAIGFIGLFTIGGLTGLFLAAVGLDIHVTDTYFIIAHFHYIMVGGTIMGYLGGLHYWWPKISGRLYNEYPREAQRGDHLRRLQPDVLPAVHRRLPRDAAPYTRIRRSFRC